MNYDLASVGIIYNPISGKGRGESTVLIVTKLLKKLQIEHKVSSVEDLTEKDSFTQEFKNMSLIIIAGGDGTLQYLLYDLSKLNIPIYMLPVGNESLFAKEFGMSTKLETIKKFLRHGNSTTHYVPQFNGKPFFTMLSIGLDSCVIELISKKRTGTISHLSYIIPTLQSLFSHTPPELSVSIDGKEVINNQKGFLIIANNKQYALGLNFAEEAKSISQELEIVFIPYNNPFGFMWNCLKRLIGLKIKKQSFRGSEVKIECSSKYPVQADGEHIGSTPGVVKVTGDTIRILTV